MKRLQAYLSIVLSLLLICIFNANAEIKKDLEGLLQTLKKAGEMGLTADVDSTAKTHGFKDFKSAVKYYEKKFKVKLKTEDAKKAFIGIDRSINIQYTKENSNLIYQIIKNSKYKGSKRYNKGYLKVKEWPDPYSYKAFAISMNIEREFAEVTKNPGMKKITPFEWSWGWDASENGAKNNALYNCEQGVIKYKVAFQKCIVVDVNEKNVLFQNLPKKFTEINIKKNENNNLAKTNIAQVEETNKTQEKLDDGIDLLSSIKTQKKSKNNSTKSNFDDEEIIRFNLIDSKDNNYYQSRIYSLAEISRYIEKFPSQISIGDIVNIHTGGDGFYKGEMISNLPEGKGKWSNCHKERFSKLDLSKTIETCEIIVGNWKNGTLNGYAKIFYLGSPTKIPDLETLWKDVHINTNFLTTNFSDSVLILEDRSVSYGYAQGISNKVIVEKNGVVGSLKPQRINTEKKYANIFAGNFQNNVVTDNLSTRITSNRGQMIISSLNEDGNPDGIGVNLFTDGSIIIGIYENGNLNLNNNIKAFINTDKNKKTLKSSRMGEYLENYQETFANYKNFIHAALLDDNFIKKSDKQRKTEFKLKKTFLKEYDKFPQIKQMTWNEMNIPAKHIGNEPPLSDRPIVLGVNYNYNYNYIPFDTDIDIRKSSFSYYRGKISEIRENGQIVFNGRARKINYNDKYFSLEEGDFKDGLFVYGFQIYDDGSKPRVNIPLNFKIKVSGQREKKLDHTAEVYYGSLNEKGPNGDGIMVMPNGMVYIGEWKDNRFHGNGELKKYGNKQPYRNKSNQTKTIPSQKYSLKGNFEDGKFQGKMEGYVFDSDADAAGVITDIVKKDISGLYSKGKLVKSSVVKKVEAKKLDRPVFKPEGDPTQAIIQATNLAAKIGCSGYQMDGIFGKFLIYPCASYEEYKKAILKFDAEKKENLTSDKRSFKTGKALFANIKNETDKSFFVDDVEVFKYQNKTKIKKIDFNSSQCEIIATKFTNNSDLYYENENYLIDIENGIIVRKRVHKTSKEVEEKTFNIREIIGDFERLDYTFYDQDKKSYILTEDKDKIKEFIIKNKNSKFFEIKTHPIEVIRQMEFNNNDVKDYSLALSDEALTILIPLNFEQGKGAYSLDKIDIKYLKKNYSIINSSYGVSLERVKAGNEKWASFNPMDRGKQTKTACAKLSKDKESGVDIASKQVSSENKVGSIDYYLNNIKQAGLYGLVNYGIAGEEEPFFEAYAINSSQKVTKNSEKDISERLEETAEVLKLHEIKFTSVLKCKNPNFITPDLFFVGIDKTIIRLEQLETVKEKYPDIYSEIPVYHIVRFSENINSQHAESSYIRGDDELFDLVTEDIYEYQRENRKKDFIIEKVENDTITLVKNFTKLENWQQRFGKGHIIQQLIKIDLKNSNVNYKHMIFFAGDSTYSWYQPPEEVEFSSKCENIRIN